MINEDENQIEWENLTLSNDFIFSKLMRDKTICKQVIEVLLNLKVGYIEFLEEQKSININYDAKSVRLDVYAEDGNRIYNIEIQTSNSKELYKRTRYYQGLIDLNTIEKGNTYHKLKESYVVFICTFDPFKKGLPKYTFENVCRENNEIKLGDGAYKVFFNANSYNLEYNENLKLFLKYIDGEIEENDILNNDFIKVIHNRVREIKVNREWRVEYMTLRMREEEIAIANREEGRKEGKIEGKIEIAKNMINMFSVDDISAITGLPIEEIEQLKTGKNK